MHQPLPLPLDLLQESDAIKIGKTINLFGDDYVKTHPYFRVGIGDIGGHVRTLEYFYKIFSQELAEQGKDPYQVKIENIMKFVKSFIKSKYCIQFPSQWLTEPFVKAILILGLPVDKYDKITVDNVSMSYRFYRIFIDNYRELLKLFFDS